MNTFKSNTETIPMDASTNSHAVQTRFDDGAGLLTLSFQGTVTRTGLEAALARLLQTVKGGTVNGVVLDARYSTPAYSPADLIDAVEQGLEEISPKRCAFVTDNTRSEALMLLETVSFPYAVRVRAFTGVDEARDWVLAAL